MTDLDELQALLIPPIAPVGVGTPEAWRQVEERLGTPLPQDYKSFVDVYGLGAIDGQWQVLNPFTPADNLIETLDSFRPVDRSEWGPPFPYPIYPTPGGLIPWARFSQGILFWVTDDPDPDRWTVFEFYNQDLADFPGSMSAYLLAVITKSYDSDVIGSEFPLTRPVLFDPWFQFYMVRVTFEPTHRSVQARLDDVESAFGAVARRVHGPNEECADAYYVVPRRGWLLRYTCGYTRDYPDYPDDEVAQGPPYGHGMTLTIPETEQELVKPGLRRLTAREGFRARKITHYAPRSASVIGVWPDLVSISS